MAEEVRRILTKFRRGSDNRESEADVTDVPFDVICRVVPPGRDDPLLYDCYELNQTQLAAFAAYVSEEFETDRYDYYLEAESA